jgi:integrase
MPRRTTETATRIPLPGEKYGYIEANTYGIAELRYKGRRRSLGIRFDIDPATLLRAAKKEFVLMKQAVDTSGDEPKRPRVITTEYAEERFCDDRQVEKMADAIRISYDAMFRHFFPVEFPLNDDTLYDHLSQHLPTLRERLAPNNLANLTGRFDQFVRYCVFRRWLSRNPWDGGLDRPKRPIPEEKTPLTSAQITALYRYCLSQPGDHWRDVAALLQLYNAAALRISEAISLHWRDAVDNPKLYNTIDATQITLRFTKNGEREIPFGGSIAWLQQIERAVRRLERLRDVPVIGQRGRRRRVFRWTNTRQAHVCIAQAFKAVGIPVEKLKGHLFRTVVEKRWMDAGVSEDAVVLIVGHTTETRRRHYNTKQTAGDTVRLLTRDVGVTRQ